MTISNVKKDHKFLSFIKKKKHSSSFKFFFKKKVIICIFFHVSVNLYYCVGTISKHR